MFEYLLLIAITEVAKPNDVPISKIFSGLKYSMSLISKFALLLVIPATSAIFETCLSSEEKIVEPAPKSVTLIVLLFSNKSFLMLIILYFLFQALFFAQISFLLSEINVVWGAVKLQTHLVVFVYF